MANKNVKDTAFLILALAVIIGSRLMPGMWGLSQEAMGVLGVFFGSLILWITISIDWPSMITLMALGFLPTFGFSKTFAGAFGNTTVALSVLTALPAGSVSVGTVVCMVGFAAGVSSMTPAGQSTVNTVAIGSGWTTAKSMFIWGGFVAVMAILVLSFVTYPLGSLIIQ